MFERLFVQIMTISKPLVSLGKASISFTLS
jgi:hypothetical protein